MTATTHRPERFAHALYGLIVITATLVAEQEHIDDPLDAIGLLVGTAVVLFLVHLYVGVMAERAVSARPLRPAARSVLVKDNIVVAAAVVLPIALFVLAHFNVLAMDAAYALSIGFSIVALGAVGGYQGRRIGLGGWHLALSALFAAFLGVLLVLAEALFD